MREYSLPVLGASWCRATGSIPSMLTRYLDCKIYIKFTFMDERNRLLRRYWKVFLVSTGFILGAYLFGYAVRYAASLVVEGYEDMVVMAFAALMVIFAVNLLERRGEDEL